MTTKGEWTVYTGSDKQDDELENARNGYILRCLPSSGNKIYETPIMFGGIYSDEDSETFTSKIIMDYWIIPDDPLREMKLRHDATGQPVWIRQSYYDPVEEHCGAKVFVTTTPDWHIPNAEYSFTPFEE